MNQNKLEVSAGAVGAPAAFAVGAASVLATIVGGFKQFEKGKDRVITEDDIEDYIDKRDPEIL